MIDSNEIQTALQAALKPQLLETAEQLQDAANAWKQAKVLGLDTEFLRERTFWAELGLVQVSDGQQAWLVDVVKISDLGALKAMFANQAILKVFHSSSEDFEALWHALGVSPQPVADTQIACAMVGQPLQMSYHNAVKWLTGIEVDKDQTRSNWLRRPLTERQLHYAATDVVFLPMLLRETRNTLQQQTKWQWLEEECNRAIAQSQESLEPNLAYLRLGAAASLNSQQLKVLRELAAWREVQAMQRNLARGFVITDAELVQVARNLPATEEELEKIEGLHERSLQKYSAQLHNAVEQGLKSTQTAYAVQALDKEQKKAVNDMRDLVQNQATEHAIDPALLASRKVLESLLRSFESGGEIPERLSGWRYPVITEKLLAYLQHSD
jgi:ribonuclease D